MRGIIGGMASVAQTTSGEHRGLFARGMRLVVAYVRMHPKPFFISVAGSLLFAVSSVALTSALGRATDQVLKPSFTTPVPASSIWLAVLALMTFGVGRALGIMFRRYYSGVAGERVMATLRNRVADRYRDR
jgi:ATP-binding cassette, subfamily B, bacterial